MTQELKLDFVDPDLALIRALLTTEVGSPNSELLRIGNLAEFVGKMRGEGNGNGNGNGHEKNRSGLDKNPVISRPVEISSGRANRSSRMEGTRPRVPAERVGGGRRRKKG